MSEDISTMQHQSEVKKIWQQKAKKIVRREGIVNWKNHTEWRGQMIQFYK